MTAGLTPRELEKLRQRAAERTRGAAAPRVPDDVQHELDVHRAELEVQNDELRQTQVDLEQARRLYFLLYDLAPVGYFGLDDRGTIRRVNLTGADLLGVERAKLVGHPISAYIGAGQARVFFSHIAQVLASRRPATCELPISSDAGSEVWVRVQSDLAPDGSGDGDTLLTTMTDITDRIHASDELEKSEQQLRAVLDHAPVGIAITDADAMLTEWNPRLQALLGCAPTQLVRHSIVDVIEPADRGRYQRVFQHVLQHGTPPEPEHVCIRRQDGTLRRVRLSVSGLPSAGESLRVIHLIEDRTDELSAEDERRRLQGELEGAHADKLRALGQLAGGIAHDFNNMLSVILSCGESLRSPDGEPDDPALGALLDATLRARDLVRRILTFARREEPRPRPLSLRSVVRDALRIVRAAVPKNVEVRLAPGSDDAVVLGDAGQLEQVVVNLSTNALHALEDGGGRISFRVGETVLEAPKQIAGTPLAAGRYATLEVDDDGAGMDAETRSHIFEPYFTTRSGAGGSGVGLALVHGIVTVHGGVIEAESEPGRGTSFRIHLPARPPGPVEPEVG